MEPNNGWLAFGLFARAGADDLTLELVRKNWVILSMFCAVISGGSITYYKVEELSLDAHTIKRDIAEVRADVKGLTKAFRMLPRDARRTEGEAWADPSSYDFSLEAGGR